MKIIQSMDIHQFRGLRDVQFDDFGDINFFVGNGNSGKTSVLEALYLWRAPNNGGTLISTAYLRPHSANPSIFQAIKYLFPVFGDNEIKLTSIIKNEKNSFKVSGDFETRILSYTDFDDETGEEVESEREIECFVGEHVHNGVKTPLLLGAHYLRLLALKEVLLPLQYVSPSRHLTGNVMNEDLLPHKESITKLLRLFDEDIIDFESAPDKRGYRNIEYIKHKIHGLMPLFTFGDGLRRALVLASHIAMSQNGVLLIDEIDTSMHISILPKIFNWLAAACKAFNVQLFATTHSLDAVHYMTKSAVADPDIDLVIYKIDKHEGRFYPKRYSEEKLMNVVVEMGMDIR